MRTDDLIYALQQYGPISSEVKVKTPNGDTFKIHDIEFDFYEKTLCIKIHASTLYECLETKSA